jgi:putative membrane protein
LQVFDFERWKKHRSSSRYLRHALGFFESRIVAGLALPLSYVMVVCTAVAGYHLAAEVRP